MHPNVSAMRLAVLAILGKWEYYDWSVQGFGVLRLHIRHPYARESCGRLHIWNSDLRYPDVSMIHNHSWDLKSAIVCGSLMNERFHVSKFKKTIAGSHTLTYMRQRLMTGYDSAMVEAAPEDVLLFPQPREFYEPGDTYEQRADEIHQTIAEDGTVTLMDRTDDNGPGYADVFWPAGTTWGSAKPRLATGEEIYSTINKALWLMRSQ